MCPNPKCNYWSMFQWSVTVIKKKNSKINLQCYTISNESLGSVLGEFFCSMWCHLGLQLGFSCNWEPKGASPTNPHMGCRGLERLVAGGAPPSMEALTCQGLISSSVTWWLNGKKAKVEIAWALKLTQCDFCPCCWSKWVTRTSQSQAGGKQISPCAGKGGTHSQG